MDLNVWLPPAVIIAVLSSLILLTNKRIDDLRQQMKSDHQNLANHLTRVENKLDAHITNYEIHNMKGD